MKTKRYQSGGSMDLDEAAEEAAKGAGLNGRFQIPEFLRSPDEEGKTASGLPREARGMKGSGRISNLPSDDAKESNKKRQDKEAIEAAKRIARGIAGAPTGTLSELAAKKMVGYAKGGKVGSASKRADGCAIKGKTRGRIV